MFLSLAAAAGTVRLSGDVSRQSVDHLISQARQLKSQGDTNIVVELNSAGGDLQAALNGFRALREIGVTTLVRSSCASSCTALFAGGARRLSSRYASFYFHQVSASPRGRMDPEKVEEYRRRFAEEWLQAVSSASGALAAELDRDGILLRGERSYSGAHLLSYGFVTEVD